MVAPSPETGLLSVLELVGHFCPGRGYRFHILRRWLTVRGTRVSAAPSGNVSGVLEISSTGAPKVRRRQAQPLVEFVTLVLEATARDCIQIACKMS